MTLKEQANLTIGHLEKIIDIENSNQLELIKKLREYIHEIFEDDAEFIVLASTRMFNLVDSVTPDLLKLYKDKFINISNKNIEPNCDLTINEITNYFKKNRYYPAVHIYDDLTYDGAKIAEFIYKLKKNLMQTLNKDNYEIEKILKDSVKIHTFAKYPKENYTLINKAYEIEPFTELQINEMNYLLTLIAYNNFSLGYSGVPYSVLMEINEYFAKKVSKNNIDNINYRGSNNNIFYSKEKDSLSILNIKSNIEDFYFLSENHFINIFVVPNIINNESLNNYSLSLSYYLKDILGSENKLSSLLECNNNILNEGKMELITYLMSLKKLREFLNNTNNNAFKEILGFLKFNNVYNKITEYDFDKLYSEIPFNFKSFEYIVDKYNEYSKERYKSFDNIENTVAFKKINLSDKETNEILKASEEMIYEIGIDMQEYIFSKEIRREKLVGNEDLPNTVDIDNYLDKINEKDKLKYLEAFLIMSDSCYTCARFKKEKGKVKTLLKTE